jgi:hypothetical protein
MRNRWEDSKDGSLDDPVTVTERQLRSLKRGARAGVFALILALAAGGLAGWSSVEGGKLDLASLVSAMRHSTENGPADVAPGAPAAASNTSSADSVRGPASQPAATPAATSQPVTPAVPASKPTTTSGRGAKHATAQRGAAPVTQSFEATAPSPAPIPARDAAPISAESRKPAIQDSSAAHH